MKINKQLPILMGLFLVFMLGVYANTDSVTIALDTTTWRQNTNVSFTLTGAGNVTNLLVRASATNIANSSSSLIINISNTTITNFQTNIVNFTFGNSIVFEDTTGATITLSARNVSADEIGSSSTSSVIIDRSAPSPPTSLTTAKRVDGDTITATVTGINTTVCFISFGLGGIRNSMTHSGDTCTYTVAKNSPSDGSYVYKVYASDGLNESASSDTTIEIDALSNPARRSPSSLDVTKPIVSATQGSGVNMQTFLKFAILFVVLDLFFKFGIIFKK